MARIDPHHTLQTYTEEIARLSRTRDGVPAELASRARDITLRNLAHLGQAEIDAEVRRRVRAYFRAVVRRSAARSRVPGAREYRLRAMAASVAEDLRASGADGERISREVAAWVAAHEGAA